MSRLFLGSHEMLARKPAHGQPCTRCGLCCVATLCELGRHVFKREAGPCPALVLETGSSPPAYTCGLAVHATIPESMREAAQLLIGAGDGCDARFNGEHNDEAFTARLNAEELRRHAEYSAARAAWGYRLKT